jgi:positive regulator of sigma E activity
MECVGTVDRVEGRRAVVRVDRSRCGTCAGCVPMTNRGLDEEMEFEVDNQLDAGPGDQVVLNMPSGNVYRAYLVVFGVPVLAMVLGYLLGALVIAPIFDLSTQPVGAACAVAAGAVFFWVAVRLSKRIGLSPSMERISGGGGEAGG